MPRGVYRKLVRDCIPELIGKGGATAITKRLSESEYAAELNWKLMEEALEYLESGKLEELADLWEVVLAILKMKGWRAEQLEEARLRKLKENGGFDKRIFLERVEED